MCTMLLMGVNMSTKWQGLWTIPHTLSLLHSRVLAQKILNELVSISLEKLNLLWDESPYLSNVHHPPISTLTFNHIYVSHILSKDLHFPLPFPYIASKYEIKNYY